MLAATRGGIERSVRLIVRGEQLANPRQEGGVAGAGALDIGGTLRRVGPFQGGEKNRLGVLLLGHRQALCVGVYLQCGIRRQITPRRRQKSPWLLKGLAPARLSSARRASRRGHKPSS